MTYQVGQEAYSPNVGISIFPNAVRRPRDPTNLDVEYPLNQVWVNTTTNEFFVLVSFDSSSGAVLATWQTQSGRINSITPDSGDIVVGDADGNINVLGTLGITTVGTTTDTLTITSSNGQLFTKLGVDTSSLPGTDPVVPTSLGQIDITGAQVAATTVGANVIRTNSTAANQAIIEIQRSTTAASSTPSSNGVCHFSSSQFNVDSSGFVELMGGGGAIDTFITNVSGPVVPDGAGEVLVNASTTTFTDGSVANTLKTEVQASDNLLLVGRGTNTPISTITAGTQGQILAQNTVGGDPVFTRTVDGDGIMEFRAFTTATEHVLASSNEFTSSGSNAVIVANVAGGSGIPACGCTIEATRFFSDIIDQTDSNSYKLITAANSDLTSGVTLRRVTTAGIFNYPLQASFSAYLSATASSVTGDGTLYRIAFSSELFDQGGNFTTGASAQYTSPTTSNGTVFSFILALSGIGANHTNCLLELVTTQNASIVLFRGNAINMCTLSGTLNISGAISVPMAATNTAYLNLTVSGGAKTVSVVGGTSGTIFAGNMVC